ncbi:MAG: PAS domain S-box protein [Candidatus Acidiferrales bacterium]|jgi:PAS domain S-box-containing protein
MNSTFSHEWLCQRIVEETQVAIIFSDRDGIIRLWNSGAEAMFGYRAEEALGQTLDLIVPERQRSRHWEGYTRVMGTGVTRYGRELLAVPALTKDGKRISIEFSIALLRTPSGELLGATAILQDVTVRWQQQKDLKSRLATLEAKLEQVGKSG